MVHNQQSIVRITYVYACKKDVSDKCRNGASKSIESCCCRLVVVTLQQLLLLLFVNWISHSISLPIFYAEFRIKHQKRNMWHQPRCRDLCSFSTSVYNSIRSFIFIIIYSMDNKVRVLLKQHLLILCICYTSWSILKNPTAEQWFDILLAKYCRGIKEFMDGWAILFYDLIWLDRHAARRDRVANTQYSPLFLGTCLIL